MIREILKLLNRDNLQVQALSQSYEMIDLCQSMVNASVESLRNSDNADVDIDIYEMDKKLNAFERDVRRKVLTHLSLGNTADIGSGLTLVCIVIDLERIGDYSKNIYDLAVNHPSRLVAGSLDIRCWPSAMMSPISIMTIEATVYRENYFLISLNILSVTHVS